MNKGVYKMLFTQWHKKQILKAIAFVKSSQKKSGLQQQRFCKIENNEISVADDYSALGHSFNLQSDEDEPEFAFPDCTPNTFDLEEALKALNFDFVVKKEKSNLILTCEQSGAVHTIPCIKPNLLLSMEPDKSQCAIENKAFKLILGLLGEAAGTDKSDPNYCCVYVGKNIACATNRKRAIQIWHAEPLQNQGFILAEYAKAIGKKKTGISEIGFNEGSITFYFAFGGWFKTQLFAHTLIDYESICTSQGIVQAYDLSELTTKKVLDIIAKKDKRATLHFAEERLTVLKDGKVVFSTEIEALQDSDINVSLKLEDLLLINSALSNVAFCENRLVATTSNIRCAIAYVV